MWSSGFVDEVRALEARGLRDGRTASPRARLPAGAAVPHGEISADDAREETIRATRRFARRQDAWFRKDPRIAWIAYDDRDPAAAAMSAVRSSP